MFVASRGITMMIMELNIHFKKPLLWGGGRYTQNQIILRYIEV